VRPTTLISKNIQEIRDFIDGQKKGAIVKPLQGSGGKNVFKITSPKDDNLNQIFEAVSGEGYLIAQAYMPEATEGDVRFFMMNGRPLMRDGKYAAFRRVPAKGEIRSNVHVGGGPAPVEVTDTMLEIADTVRPKLIHDGMFLVGLDIVGDKVLEINVFTPGGLNNLSEMYETNFAETVIDALEEKMTIRDAYGRRLSNRELATL
jgi:glutathione synthase